MLLDNERLAAAADPAADCGDPGRAPTTRKAFFGCYAFPNHVMPQLPEFDQGIGIAADSLLKALRAEFPAAEVRYEPGCRSAAGTCRACAAVLPRQQGPMWWCSPWVIGPGFRGRDIREGCDAEDLNLPGHQPELVEAIFEAGRPTVLLAHRVARTRLGNTRVERRQSCKPSSLVRRVGAPWPACYLAGSIRPASCQLGCPAMRAVSRTPT